MDVKYGVLEVSHGGSYLINLIMSVFQPIPEMF